MGYAHNTVGELIFNSRGECIKTTYWTAENAIPECEGMEEVKVIDSDQDGVADGSDKCPGSASGAIVDTSGCKLKENISLENVLFNTGTADIDNESQNILQRVTEVLKENQHLSFEIAGHTDNSGNYDNHVKLSEMRAQSVRQFLVDRGIAPERLQVRGYGPDHPLASNDTAEGRRKNRRVELNRLQ